MNGDRIWKATSWTSSSIIWSRDNLNDIKTEGKTSSVYKSSLTYLQDRSNKNNSLVSDTGPGKQEERK